MSTEEVVGEFMLRVEQEASDYLVREQFIGNPKRISVSGKRYSGKDEVVKILCEKRGFRRVATADSAKKDCAEVYGLDSERLITDVKYKEENRPLVISHAMKGRKEDKFKWIHKTYDGVKNFDGTANSDTRFINEKNWFAFNDFITVRVEAKEEVRKQRGWTYDPEIDNSPSECELDGSVFDYVIHNNSTKENLEKSVLSLLDDAMNQRQQAMAIFIQRLQECVPIGSVNRRHST